MKNKKHKHICIIASYDASILNFRKHFIIYLLKNNYNVTVIIPKNSNMNNVKKIKEIGVKCIFVPMDPNGKNIISDIKTFFYLCKELNLIKPTHVLSYTIKPVIYGTLSARILGIKNRFSLITGLGTTFMPSSIFDHAIYCLVKFQYKLSLKNVKGVIFQNPDDQKEFKIKKIITHENSYIVNGSGVDTSFFYARPSILSDKIIFLMIARIIKDKGIYEFFKAAKEVNKKYPNVIFQVAGNFHSNPSAINKIQFYELLKNNPVMYLGKLNDVRPAIESSSVFVLPSYREGTPRSVLEAMAMSRPIITTDAPGCRETVVDGYNGFLVPPKSTDDLILAIERFVCNPVLITKMGECSRYLAKKKYDINSVNKEMLNIIDGL